MSETPFQECQRIIRELRAENERLRAELDLERDYGHLSSENARLRAERDNWEAACSGSLKEQFRLARENEARLKLALDQLDKAAAEMGRLQSALAIMWHAYDTDNRPPHQIVEIARECYEYGRALKQARKE